MDHAPSLAPELSADVPRAARKSGVASAQAGGGRWVGRCLPLVGLSLLCLGLTACGGSGSGSGSGVAAPPVGSAKTPSISYEGAAPTLTWDRAQPTIDTSNVYLTLHNTTTADVKIFGGFTQVAITTVKLDARDPTLVRLVVYHRPTNTYFNGTYTDRITVYACLDEACDQQIGGSPLTIPITTIVTGVDPETGETGPPPDPYAPPLSVQSRVALTHDVIDAEYRRSLDRIVMVATYPVNALYVYDVATGMESSVPLARLPTAVSVSPDGLTAAVGHDGLISVVDLTQVGQAPAQDPVLLSTSEKVYDLVLDGRGQVHFIPDTNQVSRIHRIDIATGNDVLDVGVPTEYGRLHMRLHPSGDFLFVGDPLVSDPTFEKWDITGPADKYVTAGTFSWADPDGCVNMWFNESGTHVYLQCGQVFETESQPNTYLAPLGRLGISGPDTTNDPLTVGFNIVWMDQLAARNEVALLEDQTAWCEYPTYAKLCYYHLGIFDSELFTRKAIYALPPIAVDGTLHVQHGLFVFYKSDGSSKFLLSQLDAMSTPDREYYLSVLE